MNEALALKADAGTMKSALILKADSATVNEALALKANLASPTLTGTPKAPTAAAGTNTTQIATTGFVKTAVDAAVSSMLGDAPAAALDTLKELGAALGNDANFAATMTTKLAEKVNKAGDAMTGNLTAPKFIGALEGNAATATKLAAARTINGVSFDGTANITITAAANGGTSASCSGNAATATKLAAARSLTIGSTAKNFDGSGNVAWTLAEIGAAAASHTHAYLGTGGGTMTGVLTAKASTLATTVAGIGAGGGAPIAIGDNDVGATYGYLPWVKHRVWSNYGYINQNSIGSYRPAADWTNSGIYIATGGSDGQPTEAFLFQNGRQISNTAGAISLVGNASTATTLQTARTINGVSFDGTANITITAAANGGTSAACSGNAATATKLATARTINGVSFDGTANITVADATKLPLTGGVLSGTLTSARVVSRAAGNDYHISSFEATGDGGSILPGYGFHQPGVFAGILQQNNAGMFSFYTQGRANYAALQVESLYASGNVTAYYSDKRLKTNLRPIKGALDSILSLTGWHYNANATAAKYGYDPKKPEVGLMAQEVQKFAPECVEQAPFDMTDVKGESKTGKHYLTLKYERLVPHLVEAIKELNAKVNKLEELLEARA